MNEMTDAPTDQEHDTRLLAYLLHLDDHEVEMLQRAADKEGVPELWRWIRRCACERYMEVLP